MSQKSNPKNRYVIAKLIDELYYEDFNSDHSHTKAFELYTHPLFGICSESDRNYRRKPKILLKTNPVKEHLVSMFKMSILLVRTMNPSEATKFQNWLIKLIRIAIKEAKAMPGPLNTEKIRRCFLEAIKQLYKNE